MGGMNILCLFACAVLLCISEVQSQNWSFWWEMLSDEDTLVIEKLPINSRRDDVSPVFFDNQLLFTSNRQNRHTREELTRYYTNIYLSRYRSKQWSTPRMNYFFNTDDNTSIAGISADRSKVYIFKSFGNGDLYYVERKPNGRWSSIRKLPRIINTDAPELSAASARDVLFFSRVIGEGNADIYYSIFDVNRQMYHQPISIESVNTGAIESDISMNREGRVLYFSSNRAGQFDIYAIWINEQNQWSAPVPIDIVNTTFDERWFFDADTMFFFSRRNEKGFYDIWTGRIEKKPRKQEKKQEEFLVQEVPNLQAEELADTLSLFEQKYRDLERVLDSMQFRPYRARVQVGAYYQLSSLEQFVFFYPAFSISELEIEKEQTSRGVLHRFLLRETFYTLRDAAVRQQQAKRQQTSEINRYRLPVGDAFIAVYDEKGERIIIYFDVERKIFKILKGNAVIYF